MKDVVGRARAVIRRILALAYRSLKKREKRINHASEADLREWDQAKEEYRHFSVEGEGNRESSNEPVPTVSR